MAIEREGQANTGRVTSVRGSVVEVEFPRAVPETNEALHTVIDGRLLVLEVATQVDMRTARCLAMGAIEGLQRGAVVERTGEPISVPVGRRVLGRLFDVLGNPL